LFAHEARRLRRSVTTILFVHGVLVASWATEIPAARVRLGLSNGQLGLTLLGVPGGAILGMRGVAVLCRRWGSRTPTQWTTGLMCLALPGPLVSTKLLVAIPAMIVFGAALGSMDVAMNAQAVDAERTASRIAMPHFHAAFSFGGLAGSILAALLSRSGASPVTHLAIAGCLSLVLTARPLTRRPRP